jgi:hypothetical protein
VLPRDERHATYLDPKIYDDGAYEATKYAERRDDIGRLMLAVMVKAPLDLSHPEWDRPAAPALGAVRLLPEAQQPEALAPPRPGAVAPRPRRAADGEGRSPRADGEGRSPRAAGAAPRPDPVVDRRDDDRVRRGEVVAPGPARVLLGAPGRDRDRGGPAAGATECPAGTRSTSGSKVPSMSRTTYRSKCGLTV